MHARKFLVAAATCAVTVSVLALTGAPASAVTSNPQPDDTAGTPVAADLIGVGSDTSMHAVKVVGDAYNATSPANKIFTYAACPPAPDVCGTITLPSGDITRPNGSGNGKKTLYGASNVPDIDFARSSSANDATETSAGLQMFPFALDTLAMVVSGNVTSNAPANLTPAQIVSIYKGDITNWSQVGGSSGTIAVKMPQTGSGTYSFWVGQLKAMNGGVDVAVTGSAVFVQEHDDSTIKNDPNAIAPFSIGRAQLLGSTLRIETGWEAKRAIYNVVRGANVADPGILAAFGSSGYFCSAAAKPLIEQAGFKQLFTPSKGGACGAPTQTATSNFVVDNVQTTTTVTVTSASASSARIVAAVTGSTAPSGTVAFYEGATLLQSGVPLTSGQGVRVQAANPGAHTYRAVFTPAANSPFLASEGTGTGTVQKATSKLSAAFPKTVKFGKKAKGTVTVTLTGSSSKATGTVTIKDGNKVVGTGTLVNGKVTITLKKKLKPGKHKLTVSWAGDVNASGSEAKVKIKALAKPKPNK